MTSDTPAPKRRFALHTWILLGLLLGVTAGLVVNQALGRDDEFVRGAIAHVIQPIGRLFLRLLLMLVVPLVFASLVVGVAGIGDIRQLGRLGFKSFAYTLAVSGISVAIGLTLTNTIRPGERVSEATQKELKAVFAGDAEKKIGATKAAAAKAQGTPLMQIVETIVPINPFASASSESPDMLHLMFFALLVGVGATLLPPESAKPLVDTMQGVTDIVTKLIGLVMYLAPLAVTCLVFENVVLFGIDLIFALGWFVFCVLLGLGLHLFGVYSLSVWLLSGIHPLEFFRRVRTAMLTAFSTSSSNATLPTALRVGEENLGIPPEINRFVLTIGATANQNGTALYEGVTILFLAQLAGVEMTLAQQLTVVFLAILGGVGTAGVPSGSIPFIIGALGRFDIEPGLIAIVLGADRILDMCRTTLNVVGDLTIATYVAKSEDRLALPEEAPV